MSLLLRALILLIMALAFVGFAISIITLNKGFDVFDCLLVITGITVTTVAVLCVKESLK